MGFPTITEKYGSLSATGLAVETVFGTPVTASTFLPMTGNTMEEDPGWFSPPLMQNARDLQIYNLYGQAKYTGALDGPLFPSNAIELLVASIGADAITGWGVYGTIATPTSTTLSVASNAGDTDITLTSPTGFVIGQEIIVGTGGAQEARLISNVVGPVVTVADALAYAHPSLTAAVTGTTTTLSSPVVAPTSTIDVTSATGIVNGTIIQVDVNTVSGGFTSEVRKVTNVAVNTLTLDFDLTSDHASGAQVIIVTSPYAHTVSQQNTLPSLTVEKNIGGYQSLQFAGCRVGKFDLKAPTSNEPVTITADMTGREVAVLDMPTPVAVTYENPFVFAEANLTIYDTLRTEVSNVGVTIDNGLKETYTYSNFHGPSFITPVTLHTSGSIDLVFDSLDDPTYGDFTRMADGTLGALSFSLVHPSSAGTITINLPQIALSKYANPLSMTDVVMSNLTYEATRGPVAGYTVQATVMNSAYLPYTG